jgi:hypothetical protein
MCNLSNEVPQLFDWDQEKNQPADRYQRAELNSSIVEFVAPTEYMVRATSRYQAAFADPRTLCSGPTSATTSVHLRY